MNIFGIYLSQNFFKIYSKTHQIAQFKKILGGACPRTSTASAWLRDTQLAQTQKKVGPPGKSCIRPCNSRQQIHVYLYVPIA